MLRKMFVSLFGLLVVGCASLPISDGFPTIPQDASIINEGPVAFCGEALGIYARTYDTNPQSDKEAIIEYGKFEAPVGEPKFTPLVRVLIDATGAKKVFVRRNGVVMSMTMAELFAVYPEPCSLLESPPKTSL